MIIFSGLISQEGKKSYCKYCAKQNVYKCFLFLFIQVNGFLQGIRDAAKQVAEKNSPTAKEGSSEESVLPKNNSSPNLQAEASCDNLTVIFPLWYVGRVVVSHRQAPPTLVDDLVERFNKRLGMSDLEKRLKAKQEEQKETATTAHVENHANQHRLAKKAKSLDGEQTLQVGVSSGEEKTDEAVQSRPQVVRLNSNPDGRPRSSSDGDKTRDLCSGKANKQLHIKTHSRNASFSTVGENRNILFKISLQSVSCLSVSTKAQLMERRLREVSFCQQVCSILIKYYLLTRREVITGKCQTEVLMYGLVSTKAKV